jgi:hypothetical protein
MALVFGGASGGGGGGGLGGYDGSYSAGVSPISQNVPGPSVGGSLPTILPPPKSYKPLSAGAKDAQLAGAFGGAGGGGVGVAGIGGIPGFAGFAPLPDPLGGGSGGGGGSSRGALGGALSRMITTDAERRQNEFSKWQEGQVRSQAAFDKGAVGQLGAGFEGLVENYNTAYGQARDANEGRYQQMLDIADKTTGQRMADISSAYNQQGANIAQQQQRLGMGNTTVGDTLQAGNMSQMQASLNRAADEMQQTKLGIIDRKEDNFPDLGGLQSIIAGTGGAFGTRGIDAMLQAFGNVRSV